MRRLLTRTSLVFGLLILPSLYSELEGPALDAIVETLSSADYLSEIVIGLDRAARDQFLRAREFFSRLPQHHRILWNDGPRLRELDADKRFTIRRQAR